MGNPFNRKISWVLAVGLVLAHLSPAAAGLLVCIAEEADPDCCGEEPASESRTAVPAQYLDGSDCGCCVTVGTVVNRADATSQKISIDVSFESSVVGGTVSPSAGQIARAGRDDNFGNPRLSSLRTVVLLI